MQQPDVTGGTATGGSLVYAGGTAGAAGQDAATGGTATGGRPACSWVDPRDYQDGRARRPEPRPQAKATPRIVGGLTVAPGTLQYVCSVQTASGDHYCTCTLVAPRAAVTAAHCSVFPGDFVRVGNIDRTLGALRTVVQTRQHPEWLGHGHDVAVLVLDRPVEDIAPAPLAVPGALEAGAFVTVAGWGVTREGATTTPRLLQSVAVPVWSASACEDAYPGAIDATMTCAGEEGKDSCSGDSGGPGLVDGALALVTAWGDGCARKGRPGVYTDLTRADGAWVRECLP